MRPTCTHIVAITADMAQPCGREAAGMNLDSEPLCDVHLETYIRAQASEMARTAGPPPAPA